MTNEQKRRLDALENATNHLTYCEKDFAEYESSSYEPFSVSPWTNVSGEVNVIYDRSGNVIKRIYHGDSPTMEDIRLVATITNEELAS